MTVRRGKPRKRPEDEASVIAEARGRLYPLVDQSTGPTARRGGSHRVRPGFIYVRELIDAINDRLREVFADRRVKPYTRSEHVNALHRDAKRDKENESL